MCSVRMLIWSADHTEGSPLGIYKAPNKWVKSKNKMQILKLFNPTLSCDHSLDSNELSRYRVWWRTINFNIFDPHLVCKPCCFTSFSTQYYTFYAWNAPYGLKYVSKVSLDQFMVARCQKSLVPVSHYIDANQLKSTGKRQLPDSFHIPYMKNVMSRIPKIMAFN